MKIAFIHDKDIRVDNDSITNYINGIIRCNTECEIDYFGVSKILSDKKQTKDQRNYYYHSVFNRRAKGFLPLTLKYIFLFWLKRYSLSLNDKLLSFNNVEWALPFLYPIKAGPTVVTIHGVSKYDHIVWKSKIKIWLHSMIEKLVFKKADKVIFVSQDGYEYYVSQYPVLKDKFIHVPTFVDIRIFFPRKDKINQRKKFNLVEKDVIIIYTGRLVKEKGIDILIDAIKQIRCKLPAFKLLIVGKGPHRDYLEELVENHELINNVIFFGAVTHHMVPELLACADLFVLPSYFESTPLAVLEAFACDVPVISFRVGDLDKILIDGQNGYLVRERTSKALADAILSGIDNINEMQNYCFETALKYRDTDVISRVFDVFKEVELNGKQIQS